MSDEENGNEDDDEMLFVRGASPVRKGSQENSSPLRRNNDHENYDSGSDYEERSNANRHRDNDNKRGARGGKSPILNPLVYFFFKGLILIILCL